MSSYARFLWLGYGLWEDINTLIDVYKSSTDHEIRLVLARHILVDFDSLDELLKEFHDHCKREELNKVGPEDAERILSAFGNYHRAAQPHRESLKQIRNNLGSHRTGEPWRKAPDSGVTSPEEWGKWEQYLVELERRCDLTQWLAVLNAALELLNLLKDFNLDAWYSWPDDGNIRLYMPILSAGYYPRDAPSDEPE